jgi:nucleotide sugar dehydrogenase
MRVAVVALGKIGLPLAVQFVGTGHQVIGCDVNSMTIGLISAGSVPFPGEAELDTRLRAALDSGRLTVTVDTVEAVRSAEVVVVVVPLVVDAEGVADFAALDAATGSIAAGVQPGTLVVYETTLPVGTTRTRFAPALAARSGLTLGTDLFVCHSPERVSSGRIFADLRRYPKLVGGIDDASASAAVAFYDAALTFDDRPDLDRPNGVWNLGSAEAAELAKLAETTYRDLNIAYANELAMYADRVGLDIYDVIAASNSQPYSHIHQPGIAVGGHCIPVYPRFYLATRARCYLALPARSTRECPPMRSSVSAGSSVRSMGCASPCWVPPTEVA